MYLRAVHMGYLSGALPVGGSWACGDDGGRACAKHFTFGELFGFTA